MVMTSVNRMIPPSTNIAQAYANAGDSGQELVLNLALFLSNFLSILSYWTAFFIVIVAEEHFLFRRAGGPLGGYNLEDWDSASR